VLVEGDGVGNVASEGVGFENAVASIMFKGSPEVSTLLASAGLLWTRTVAPMGPRGCALYEKGEL